jgi:hypothetical protein
MFELEPNAKDNPASTKLLAVLTSLDQYASMNDAFGTASAIIYNNNNSPYPKTDGKGRVVAIVHDVTSVNKNDF